MTHFTLTPESNGVAIRRRRWRHGVGVFYEFVALIPTLGA